MQKYCSILNPFQINVTFLYPMRTCFQEVWKWNIGLKLVKIIMNNFMNGYLILICSYQQAELSLIGSKYAVNRLNPQLLDQEAHMLTTTLTHSHKFGWMSLTVTLLNRSLFELCSQVNTDKD